MIPGTRLDIEKKTIYAMIHLYCKKKHGKPFCSSCDGLLQYAFGQIDACPFDQEKPPCSECEVHCYIDEMRKKIREVMRFAGPRMLLSHPILAIHHLWKGGRVK